MRNDRYFSGQGRVYIAERNSDGTPAGFRRIGNCPELQLSLDTEGTEHKESETGFSVTDRRIETGQMATFNMTLDNFSKENLELAIYGESNAVVSGTGVTGEEHTAPAPGYSFYLENMNIDTSATFTIVVDPGGADTATTDGTDYTYDPLSGRVDILAGGAISEGDTLGVDYTFLDQQSMGAFTKPNTNKWVTFEGLNRAEDYSPVVINMYKVRFNPLDSWDLINDDFAQLSLEGTLQYDTLQPADAIGGRFLSIKQPVR